MRNQLNKIRTLDLFCGAGGSSWGAAQAGAQILAGFDKWELTGKVYHDNFPEATFYCVDLAEIDPRNFNNEIGDIDLIIASPECTNHSPAKGNAERCEKSRETAFHVTRFAEAFRARWVIIENVISMRRWDRYSEFLRSLENLGYHFRECILDAADFGAPQSRRRLFILCDNQSEPTEIKPYKQEKLTVRSVITTNGTYHFTPLRNNGRAKATIERAERAISELGPDAEFLIVYYGSDQAGGWQSLDRSLRTITTLDRFAYVKPTSEGHVMRMLQPEELKLAMGWPKKFRIEHGTRRDRIKMIGNAVCPNVMQAAVKTLCRIEQKL